MYDINSGQHQVKFDKFGALYGLLKKTLGLGTHTFIDKRGMQVHQSPNARRPLMGKWEWSIPIPMSQEVCPRL